MSTDLATLNASAIMLGFVHCLFGPDHYVPFVAMSRVGDWSLRKTLFITVLCGIGHVASSAVIGFIGLALGIIVLQLETTEAARGTLAGWLLTGFGLVYFVGGVVYAIYARCKQRGAADSDTMKDAEQKAEAIASRTGSFTPWVLFAIFLFGPCEPLIPFLIYPAATADVWSAVCVTLLFGVTTLVTMTVLVALIYLGTYWIRFHRFQLYGHALAGLVVLTCGLAIMFGL